MFNQHPTGVGGYVTTDLPIALTLRKRSTGSVTSVTVTTATNIAAISSDGGTDTYAFATYTTMGALVDAINADGIFHAKLLDCLRSDATASVLVDGAITAGTRDGYTVWDAKVDTSAGKHLSRRLGFTRVAGVNIPSANQRVHLKYVKYLADVNAATADSVQIFEIDGNDETQVYSNYTVDNAATTEFDWSQGLLAISAKPGNELLVRVKDATSLADGGYLWANGVLEQSGLTK